MVKIMKKVLLASLSGLSLVGCGGGGGGDSTYVPDDKGNGGTVNAEAQGVYSGSTNQGQTVTGIVDETNKFWFLYTPPYKSGVTGFITGDLKLSGKAAHSTNAKDYNFSGAVVYDATIVANIESKKSLNGNLAYSASNQVTFNTNYNSALSGYVPKLSDIVGTYKGASAIVQGIESATVYIANNGEVSGRGASGCAFTGNATVASGTPYFKLSLIFGNSPCYMAGQAVNGIIYYDAANKALYAVAENSNRQNAVLFLATK